MYHGHIVGGDSACSLLLSYAGQPIISPEHRRVMPNILFFILFALDSVH